MRRWIIVVAILGVIALGAVFAVVVVANVVFGGEEQAADAAFQNSSCDATLGSFSGNGAVSGAAQAANLSAEQQQTVTEIIAIGKQRNLPALAWQVAIQAGMQESGLRNINYGDRDSVGIFQMRPSQGWGTPQQLTDPTYEINKFYDVLTGIPNWQQQRPGTDAQLVERSAFPLAYNNWEAMAASLVSKLGSVTNPSGCTAQLVNNVVPAPTQAASVAIAFALSQIGKPYVWGATGPDSYDCSGLMLRAYQAAGIDLPRVSADQYHAGALLPVHNAQPGDLMFLAYDPNDPATIHHVFMYLGNNMIVEAPYTGQNVREVPMNWNNPQLVQQAVRPGV